MKRLLLLAACLWPIFIFAQQPIKIYPFSAKWNEIERLISIKNYEQTMPILAEVKAEARRSNQSATWVRASLAESNIQQINSTSETSFIKIQNHFIQNIEEAKPLEKSVLQNFYALFLWANTHRYLSESSNPFIAMNSKEKLAVIDSIFKLSLLQKEALVREPIQQWKDLFDEMQNLSLTPTLYHVLVYSYMDFLYTYSSGEQQIKPFEGELLKINAQYEYNDASAYLLTRNLRIYIPDTSQINKYQDVIDRYKSDYNAYLLYQIAQSYHQIGKRKEALHYAQTALNDYSQSPWIDNAKNLSLNIQKAQISLLHDLFVPSDQYLPIKIEAVNTDTLFIRVYNITNLPEKYTNFNVRYDSITCQAHINAPLVYEEQVTLKSFDDYQEHSTIYRLNPLPYGNYKLLISNNKAFQDDGVFLDVSTSDIYITDLFVTATLDKEKDNYDLYSGLLINRKTGTPFAKEKVQLYETSTKHPPKLIQSLTTNAKGEFTYKTNERKKQKDLDAYCLFVPKENQFIDLMDLYNVEEHTEENFLDDEGDFSVQTLTDRAIYRPGQTVYFKSILYNNHMLLGKVLEKKDVKVFLHDAHGQKIDSLVLTTNNFGSVHGSFVLPNKTLSGSFRITVFHDKYDIDSHYFRVEEYKRPTFKVSFETNKETYTLQDTAVFVGLAETLSGAPLSEATVNYKVNFYHTALRKTVNFADSTIIVDQNGKFIINVPLTDSIFQGLTSFSLDYSAEVINQTGETQAANGSYRFSTRPRQITIKTDFFAEEGKWKNIDIQTQNINGQPLKFPGAVHIYKFSEPSHILTNAYRDYFKQADYHLLSNQEYQTYFPHYFDDLFLLKEEQKTLIKSYSFDTRDTSLVQIDSSLFSSGRYQIEAISVQEGDTVKAYANTNLYHPETRKINELGFLNVNWDKPYYSLGDKVTMVFQSDVKDVKNLFLFVSQGSEKEPAKILNWKNGEAKYSFVLRKEHISPEMSFTSLLVINNQLAIVTEKIPIVRNDKSLNIRVGTFRDKITPGQKEKWNFTIEQTDKIPETELLATMYDSALDAFSNHRFPSTFQFEYPYYSNIDFRYLQTEFNQKSYTYSVFNSNFSHTPIANSLSHIRSYGLWDKLMDKYGYGTQRRFTSTGASSLLTENLLAGRVPGIAVTTNDSMEDTRGKIMIRGISAENANTPLYVVDGEVMENFNPNNLNKDDIHSINILKDPVAVSLYGSRATNGVIIVTTKEGKERQDQLDAVQARDNLQETAFFFPTLYTDAKGNVSFEFDSPEALTKWKLLLFAHGKHLEAGTATHFTQTQKQLMVRPNLPRYFREGDQMVIKAQVQNLSKTDLSGNVRIEIIDPETQQVISPQFVQDNATRDFQVSASNNSIVSWKLQIPADFSSVQIKIVAASADFSDGEIHEIPILSNKILVSDSERITLKPDEIKNYTLNSAGKDNLQAKIQVQSNPMLEVLSALDYLKNYPYECSEQTTSKWFGLQMVKYIQKNYPAIVAYFQAIGKNNTKGKLEENVSLGELSLEEMPWLRDALGEQKRLKAVAQLFDANVQQHINDLERKMTKNQLENGGFTWFEGGEANTAISIRILEIMGKVQLLDKSLISQGMRERARTLVRYLDNDSSIFNKKSSDQQILNYLYARQYWNGTFGIPEATLQKLGNRLSTSPEITATGSAGFAAKAWVVNQLFGDAKQSNEIKNRLTQEVIHDQNKGCYWESNGSGPGAISLQSYMVEAYKLNDPSKLQDMTQWLLYNKQINHWQSTWATVDAVYALLLANNPKDFITENTIQIWVDQTEAETENVVLGQVSKELPKEALETDKQIRIHNQNGRTVYGSIHHQYFEPLEKVQTVKHDISVQKQYFVLRDGNWIESREAKLGERIKVRITVINDQPLQYVHLKDSRPSGVEPVYEPSGYKWWQRYYFSMKDASTNYFFDDLPKGKREYEYEVKANNAGLFSSGITTIECMYNPAVNARSENIKIEIKE